MPEKETVAREKLVRRNDTMVNEKSGSQNVRGSVGVCNLIPREKRAPGNKVVAL